jgi:hypothetical protein
VAALVREPARRIVRYWAGHGKDAPTKQPGHLMRVEPPAAGRTQNRFDFANGNNLPMDGSAQPLRFRNRASSGLLLLARLLLSV